MFNSLVAILFFRKEKVVCLVRGRQIGSDIITRNQFFFRTNVSTVSWSHVCVKRTWYQAAVVTSAEKRVWGSRFLQHFSRIRNFGAELQIYRLEEADLRVEKVPGNFLYLGAAPSCSQI